MIAPGVPAPLPAAGDLRTELTRHLVARAVDRLHRRDRERERLLAAGRWRELGEAVCAHVRAAFGPMPFGDAGAAVDARPVSRHETRHCGIENVLFESFPGWEVNASVFVPHGPGPFPAVVLPVGHSGKQHAEYQIPAQAFASLGFLAVLFDPPGQDSEKQPGNDHFADGVRTYLTGHSSNRYFVLDALRCIDYLATRSDVDLSRGVGMSGVSGGGPHHAVRDPVRRPHRLPGPELLPEPHGRPPRRRPVRAVPGGPVVEPHRRRRRRGGRAPGRACRPRPC